MEKKNEIKSLFKNIKGAVREAVKEEIIKDGKSMHYTNRVQNLILSRHEQPLTERIEKRVEEKIQKLVEELTNLKMRARHIVKKKKRLFYDSSDDDDDDEEATDGFWYVGDLFILYIYILEIKYRCLASIN